MSRFMVLVFDLDDTLYDERTYVESGLQAVAEFGARELGLDRNESFTQMVEILDREGRGAVFDRWLARHDALRASMVRECVRVYRHHTPTLTLDTTASSLLRQLAASHRLYVVTDGHKVVQAKKVTALGLDAHVEKVYITHRYGIRHTKPSTYCFEKIKQRERCQWSEMVYVGDDPAKDFVNLKPLGVHTVRVLTGVHRAVCAPKRYEAAHTISSLKQLRTLIARLERYRERS
jgi:putative hydrolase of the HAD superfamily